MKAGRARVWNSLAILVLAATVILAPARDAVDDPPRDAPTADVIAAVVVKLAAFVEWPASAEPGFTICSYESGPLGAALAAHQGKPARDGIVFVRRVSLPVAVGGCHVAFVGSDGPRRLEAVSEAYRGRPVLVVSDGGDAIDRGAMVGLDVSGGRVVFDLDRTAASREGVVLSSKLLRLARRIQ